MGNTQVRERKIKRNNKTQQQIQQKNNNKENKSNKAAALLRKCRGSAIVPKTVKNDQIRRRSCELKRANSEENLCECVMRFENEDPLHRAYYKGHVSDESGKFNGRGTLRWANGAEYEGEWKEGLMHGYGVLTVPAHLPFNMRNTFNATVQQAQHEKEKKGSGIEGIRIYAGMWEEGLLHGYACIWYAVNDALGRECFRGTFCRGMMEGKGEMRWRSGDRYSGVWDEGVRLLWEEEDDEGGNGETNSRIVREEDHVRRGRALMREVEKEDIEFRSKLLSRKQDPAVSLTSSAC